MKIRKFVAFGAIAALALAGCGSTPETTPTTPPLTSEAPAEDPTSDAPVEGKEISLWLAGKTDTPPELVEFLKTTFEKNTGSTLKVDQVDWSELIPRLQTALSNPDQTPDVVEVGNTQSPTFAAVGAFSDLTDHVAELGGDELGPAGFVEAGKFDGRNFALPYYWGSRYVFYNKDMFKAADLEVPANLADFNAAAEKLTTPDVSGLWLGGQDWRNGISWVFANGGNIATLEGDTWVGQMASANSVKGLTELQAIAANGTHAGPDVTDADLWVPFNEEKAAMIMAPGWARWSITLDEGSWGVFALPGVDGGAAPVFAGGSNIAISKASTNQDLALELMKIIYSDEYQTLLAGAGLGPGNSSFNHLMGDDDFAKSALASAKNSMLTPAAGGWAPFEESKAFEEFFAQIAQGKDIATEAAKIDAAVEKALN